MTLLSLIAALIAEQLQPVNARQWVQAPLARWAQFLEQRFNDGEERHGTIAWSLGVAMPAIASIALYYFLYSILPLLAFIFNVGVLYLTLGFRQVSHYFTDIHLALRMGEMDRARSLLAQWRGRGTERLNAGEIARLSIEEALLAAHRNVFAPLFWFAVLPGPSGALIFKLTDFFSQAWGNKKNERVDAELDKFGRFAARAFEAINWLPLRVTATAFAVVGDFEDAVYCWRTQAALWRDQASGILLASGAGALGVRLGMPVYESDEISGAISERPEIGMGADADVGAMQSLIGLVWRSLVLYVLVLALIGIAGLFGN